MQVATRPRQIIAGRTVFVTGRAIDRQFRFVPNEETVHTIRYCLGLVLQNYQIKVHAFVWMSNHYHLVLTDVDGRLPDFMRDLNSKISRALNANRRRRGQNFARESYNLVVPADEDAVLRHCAYTEANPCAAHLVERPEDWMGLSSAGMDYGDVQTIERPDFGMWGESEPREGMDETRARYRGCADAPETVQIRLERPPCMMQASDCEVRAAVQEQVDQATQEAERERQDQGRKVLGMAFVSSRSFKDAPEENEAFFQSEPQFSGSCAQARAAIRHSYQEFVHRYRQAWLAFKSDRSAIFPSGTWWMNRRLWVNCAAGPP